MSGHDYSVILQSFAQARRSDKSCHRNHPCNQTLPHNNMCAVCHIDPIDRGILFGRCLGGRHRPTFVGLSTDHWSVGCLLPRQHQQIMAESFQPKSCTGKPQGSWSVQFVRPLGAETCINLDSSIPCLSEFTFTVMSSGIFRRSRSNALPRRHRSRSAAQP